VGPGFRRAFRGITIHWLVLHTSWHAVYPDATLSGRWQIAGWYVLAAIAALCLAGVGEACDSYEAQTDKEAIHQGDPGWRHLP